MTEDAAFDVDCLLRQNRLPLRLQKVSSVHDERGYEVDLESRRPAHAAQLLPAHAPNNLLSGFVQLSSVMTRDHALDPRRTF